MGADHKPHGAQHRLGSNQALKSAHSFAIAALILYRLLERTLSIHDSIKCYISTFSLQYTVRTGDDKAHQHLALKLPYRQACTKRKKASIGANIIQVSLLPSMLSMRAVLVLMWYVLWQPMQPRMMHALATCMVAGRNHPDVSLERIQNSCFNGCHHWPAPVHWLYLFVHH